MNLQSYQNIMLFACVLALLVAALDALQPLQHSQSFSLQGSAVNSNGSSWQSLVAFNYPVRIVKPIPRKTSSSSNPFQRLSQQLFNQELYREESEEQEQRKQPQTQPFVDIQRGIEAAKSLKYAEQRSLWTKEIMAGLVVSLATIPTSISYSTVIGIKPLIGIWSSAIVGFFSSLIGGSPGLIVGSAGVTALPMAKIYMQYGPAYMAVALMIASAMEGLFGVLRLSHWADIVTEPVITGFLNALAIFIVKSQLKVFQSSKGVFLAGHALTSSLVLSGFTASAIVGLSKYRRQIKLPPQLLAIIISTVAAIFFQLPIKSLADFAGRSEFVGGLASLPKFNGFPQILWSWSIVKTLFAAASGVAMVSIIETLLAQRISCDSYRCLEPDHEVDQPNRSIIGLGVGNFMSSLFGGFGGCGLIPNTLLNNSSGGRGYVSGYAYSITTAIAVLLFSPLLGKIPMAALAGLMFTVAANTGEWNESWHLLRHAPVSAQSMCDCLAMLVTTYMAFQIDMGLGIAAGVGITKLPAMTKAMKRFLTPVRQVKKKEQW